MNTQLNRRRFLAQAGMSVGAFSLPGLIQAAHANATTRKPNFIVIFCDDLGYGDIGCFGSKLHRTPHIDQMAAEGLKFTSFYVTSGVCSPSRSSLMTGCYPRRVNMHQDHKNLCVLFPVGKKGLHPNEKTIAEVLKPQGYATACIGKWHLGDQKEFLPTRQGFDYYYGIPYSNDMGERKGANWPILPLLKNEKIIEAPVDQTTITKRYTQEAVKFIREKKDQPFFLYLPHTMPHNPVHSSEAFRGKSKNKGFGDCVEEIDWSTGQIFSALKEHGIDNNTMVIFTSDNGAAQQWGGSNGPLRDWKGATWEGGMRVPCVVRWPGAVPAGAVSNEMCSTIDLLPTFAELAGAQTPRDRAIDGESITTLLQNPVEAKTPHGAYYFYLKDQLQAVRSGPWKLHLPLENKRPCWGDPIGKVEAQLFDVERDIGETKNVAEKYPAVVSKLMKLAGQARADLGDENKAGKRQRKAGWVEKPVPLKKG